MTAASLDRGKVMTAEELEAGKDFGRYLDVDGDGIPYRTYPGTHPTRGAFFTRGTSKDRRARYSEEGPDYAENMLRLLKKFDTAKNWCRTRGAYGRATDTAGRDLFRLDQPGDGRGGRDSGGAWHPPRPAACARLPVPQRCEGIHQRHDQVFVVEQNRDGQLRTLLVNELEIDPARLTRVLHFDGTPITARFISDAIADKVGELKVVPFRKAVP